MGRNISIFVGICLMFLGANGQDLHFSQFMNSPLLTNPANTGFMPDADYRFGGNYRSQYASIPVPYNTLSLFGDVQAFKGKLENGWVGLGGVILQDKAGSGNLTSTKVYGSVAYHQMLGFSSLLSAGFNVGWAGKRIDFTKLTFDNQWNGKFFEAAIPNGEVFNSSSINYLDIQMGLNYAFFPNEKIYLNGGVSAHHINKPRESFFDDPLNDNRISPRYIGFVNASIKMSDNIIFNPMGYYANQAKASELVLGGNVHYNLSGDGVSQLIGGAYYRLQDAVIPMVGYQWNELKLTYTYDVTTSSLRNFNGYRGANEISLIFQGIFQGSGRSYRQALCPKF